MKDDKWWDESWNPTTGCNNDIISSGCANCYARRMATRLRGRYGYPADDPFRVTFHPDRLEQPLKWKKPRRIFACSMGDLFHNDVQFEQIDAVIRVIAKARQHTFMILTKRPGRMAEYFMHLAYMLQIVGYSHLPLPNLWLGVTAENQRTADERIPILLQIPAAVRFVSVEPMLGPVDLSNDSMVDGDWSWLTGEQYDWPDGTPVVRSHRRIHIDWVICGAETGPGARPMNLEWARDLRDQCKESNVPFFFKKAGPKGTPTPDDLMIREFSKGG
ncbi:MAG: phage Gp37/Gp68 family protein [Pseudomonadota bacterium]